MYFLKTLFIGFLKALSANLSYFFLITGTLQFIAFKGSLYFSWSSSLIKERWVVKCATLKQKVNLLYNTPKDYSYIDSVYSEHN